MLEGGSPGAPVGHCESPKKAPGSRVPGSLGGPGPSASLSLFSVVGTSLSSLPRGCTSLFIWVAAVGSRGQPPCDPALTPVASSSESLGKSSGEER